MKEAVLETLSFPYKNTIKDINKYTKIKMTDIEAILNILIKDGYVVKVNNRYFLRKKGIIQIKDSGFGFIKVDEEDKEYYVSEFNTLNSATGDIVDFYVLPSSSDSHLDEGIVIDIIERGHKHVFGLLVEKKNKKGKKYYVNSSDPKFDVKCYVDEKDLNNAVPGAIVSSLITEYTSSKKVKGVISKVLGYQNDPGIDISLIAEKYSFYKEFPQPVIEELDTIPNEVDLSLYKNRKDFTKEMIITIDGDDSKDFDDAICVKRLSNGNYYLGVFIADVSEYVKEGHPLDEEALFRATSVYLADRVIPMLPQKLSNGICSLNEGEYRLVLACEMEFNIKGKLVNYEISEGIIKSLHRMTYNNVNKMLNNDEEIIKLYFDIYPMILDMQELSNILRNIRTKKGAIDFDVPEYKATLDNKGNPISFDLRLRDKAELLIEDFMLCANENVAYHMSISNLPCVYRVHETPNQDSVKKVFEMINTTGLKVIIPKNKILPMDIQKAMNLVNDKKKDIYLVVNQMMLRSMAKAKYSEKNLGHYGLAMEYYCHFTSPIRRYPDLMVHRLIKTLILHPDNFSEDFAKYNSYIHDISVKSSVKEREAIDCEREVMDMLMASFMEDKISQEFVGKIDSITKFGMFVLLDNGIEGLIHISNMNGYFNFNQQNMTLESKEITYHIGDKVNIVVVSASKKYRKVDFMLKQDYLNYFNFKEGKGYYE